MNVAQNPDVLAALRLSVRGANGHHQLPRSPLHRVDAGEGRAARARLQPLARVRTLEEGGRPRRQHRAALTGAGVHLGDLREGGFRMRLYKRGDVWWCSYYENGVRR